MRLTMHTVARERTTGHSGSEIPVVVTGLSICIPTFNEEGAVGETLARCLAIERELAQCGIPQMEVIAVDDGSSDGTAEVIAQFPRVRLIRHERNRGYGAALKTGFAAARYDLIGFLDADATYPPEQFPRLCAHVIRDGADLVIGSRMTGAETAMPRVRKMGNAFFARLLSMVGRVPVTDSASGMRVIRRGSLDVLLPLPDGLNLTPVMSTRAVHEGIALVEVPIPYRERVGESKLNPAKDGVRFLTSIVSTALAYNPVRIFGLLGLAGMLVAAVVLIGLAVARASGATSLGPVGTFAVFGALVCGVAGVTTFALGASFNYLVSLFYKRPIRQGLFRRPLLRRPVEELFLPVGLAGVVGGGGVSLTSLALALNGWAIERLWLYLTTSAMSILVGIQLLLWWLMASVLRELSVRILERVPDRQDR